MNIRSSLVKDPATPQEWNIAYRTIHTLHAKAVIGRAIQSHDLDDANGKVDRQKVKTAKDFLMPNPNMPRKALDSESRAVARVLMKHNQELQTTLLAAPTYLDPATAATMTINQMQQRFNWLHPKAHSYIAWHVLIGSGYANKAEGLKQVPHIDFPKSPVVPTLQNEARAYQKWAREQMTSPRKEAAPKRAWRTAHRFTQRIRETVPSRVMHSATVPANPAATHHMRYH